jgi:hypothetical protein
MKKLLASFSMLAIIICILMIASCKEDTKCPVCPAGGSVTTYQVTAIVTNPQGQPQGGATLSLVNPPNQAGTFSTITDSTGKGTIEAPAGPQQLSATMGTVFQVTINITVIVNTTNVPQSAGTVQLHQNTTLGKILVVQASAEQLEDVLRVIGYTTFDSTDIYTLRDSANVDSTWVLNKLKQYSIVFSDCEGGYEGGSEYAALSRTYGRYVAQGGKMYGGHYNYYHLQRIWTSYYTTRDYQTSTDTMQIVDNGLQLVVGTLLDFTNTGDSRHLAYERFSNLPTNSKVYGVIYRTSPAVGVVVENYIGTGKYLWTDYHNQDIKDDPKLVKIVQYFLLKM